MIAFVKGTIIEVTEGKAVIEVGGMGYQILVSGSDEERLARMQGQVLLHTYLQVREDAIVLFGFLAKEDLEIFRMLIGVNGIGPKAALGILSVFSASDLRFAVLAGDAKTISKAPGIGSKTAQKLILELKDKFDLLDAFESKLEETKGKEPSMAELNSSEAVQALVALGYPGSEALAAVRKVSGWEEMNTEELLKAALKKMSF